MVLRFGSRKKEPTIPNQQRVIFGNEVAKEAAGNNKTVDACKVITAAITALVPKKAFVPSCLG
ncbi:MAG: hypothetical protein OXD38_02880 [Aestuariivita sp.]|nr:hypothetical protein [Aestuariivita sp.]